MGGAVWGAIGGEPMAGVAGAAVWAWAKGAAVVTAIRLTIAKRITSLFPLTTACRPPADGSDVLPKPRFRFDSLEAKLALKRYFVRLFGENSEALRRHVGKAAAHLINPLSLTNVDVHPSFFQGRHERGMTRQDAEVAFDARRIDLIHVAAEQFTFG